MRLTPAHSAEKTHSSVRWSVSGTAKVVVRRSLVVPGFILPLPPLPSAVPSDVSGKSASKPKRQQQHQPRRSLWDSLPSLQIVPLFLRVYLYLSGLTKFQQRIFCFVKKGIIQRFVVIFSKNLSSKIDIIIIIVFFLFK